MAWLPTDGDDLTGRMNEVSVAAFASAIHKPGPFKFGDQLTNLPRHAPDGASMC